MKKITHYLPRILAVGICLFFGVFVLEGFSADFGWQDSLIHFLTFLPVLIITILAWKKSKIGGWTFVLLGVYFGLFFHPFLWNGLLFGIVPFITGLLFLSDGKKSQPQLQ